MATTKHYSPAAASYAQALLELANESKQAEAVGSELSSLQQLLADNETFRRFLAEPTISSDDREAFLKKVFTGKASPLLLNFLGVLNAKGRLKLLNEIVDAYDALLDEQFGKVEVDVTVAARLSSDDLENVRKKVGTALNKDAVVHQYIDESIIGGLILRVQDRLIDASVKSQLAAMHEQLKASRKK